MFVRNITSKLVPGLQRVICASVDTTISKSASSFVSLQRQYSISLCKNEYERISDETLDTLCERLEDIADSNSVPDEYDVVFESGVLKLHISKDVGTYVINKQSPNKQIWFSSPKSGPKRYDYHDNSWKYSHDGSYLHALLQEELSEALKLDLNFLELPFAMCDSCRNS